MTLAPAKPAGEPCVKGGFCVRGGAGVRGRGRNLEIGAICMIATSAREETRARERIFLFLQALPILCRMLGRNIVPISC